MTIGLRTIITTPMFLNVASISPLTSRLLATLTLMNAGESLYPQLQLYVQPSIKCALTWARPLGFQTGTVIALGTTTSLGQLSLRPGSLTFPKPEGWSGPDALTQNFRAYYELVEHVAHLQFYSICIHVLSQIYAAHTFLNYTEQIWAGYIRGSPGLVAVHRYWMCKEGYSVPPDSQDTLSDDGESHFVETLHIPLRMLTPSFTGFNSEPDTNLPCWNIRRDMT
jgi:hypothetical protein